MQFRFLVLSGVRIAFVQTVNTDDLETERLLNAANILKQLQGREEFISDELSFSVSLGTIPSQRNFEDIAKLRPGFAIPDETQQMEMATQARRNKFYLKSPDTKFQIYLLLRENAPENRSLLNGSIHGSGANVMFAAGRNELSPEEEQTAKITENVICEACPAVITCNLDFTLDTILAAEMAAFAPYFAAAMFLDHA